MNRFTLTLVLGIFMAAGHEAEAENAPLLEAAAEMVMGAENAPVAMIEYSSLSCPHCANFHRETLPQIKKTYIDQGKVKLIYRDFPLEGLAMAGAMIARCSGKSKFFGLIEVMFRGQQTWTRAENPKAELERMARFGGMSKANVDACLKDEGLMNKIKERALEGQKEYKIESTPTFIINGEIINGALPFSAYQKAIDKALAP